LKDLFFCVFPKPEVNKLVERKACFIYRLLSINENGKGKKESEENVIKS